ncbi:hypothetical protein L596_017663 [Steinernema carpocapsae]|uniref:SH2 domain-containing protein n=1 Tax=Steinernema carpocapsae TaxID=34508 RepID=A0A4U5N2P8_STECR|nr:hypothetical protein L596_017663 [Steinernema carpocapsae]
MSPPTTAHNHPTLAIPTELCVSESDRWTHFCEQYARSVAYNFEASWNGFVASSLTKRPPPNEEVIDKFCRVFSVELADRLTKPNSPRIPSQDDPPSIPTVRKRQMPTKNFRKTLVSMLNLEKKPSITVWRSTESARERPASTYGGASLFRCKSEMSNYFKTVSPDQMSLSSSVSTHTKRSSWFKSKFASKKTVEMVREGNVRYLQGIDLDIKSWQKGRLCLVKTSGGYLLEFYSPPKSTRAKTGIFCLLISEVRETSDLEDSTDCTFVLKAFNGMEYVIETKTREECVQWIMAIRDSIPLGGNPQIIIDPNRPGGSRLYRKPSLPSASNLIRRPNFAFSSRSLNNVQSLMTTSRISDEHRVPVWLNCFPPGLDNYPWFHARLSRNESSQLVLHNGVDGHGLFLVRQSETRPGEFVLTFNYSNKAKHLRISVETCGECSLQGLNFASMVDLLEFFREHPLPVESSSCTHVYLKEYVICWKRAGRHAEIDPTLGDYLTHKGSVRIDIHSLENLVRAQRNRTNNYNFI